MSPRIHILEDDSKRKNPLLGDKKHFFTEITQLHTLISAIDFQFLQCNRQNKSQNRPIT